jgi:hypothetical protein
VFEDFVATVGDSEVLVRQPAALVALTTSIDKVLGKQAPAPGQGYGTQQYVLAVVSDAASALADRYASIPPQIAAIGRAEKIDILLRVILQDALVNVDAKYGPTIFDTAKDVQIGGAVFQVRATDRSGLPPEGPYILWVALRKAGE